MKRLSALLLALLLAILPQLALAIPVQIGGESPFDENAELLEIMVIDMQAASDAILVSCGGERMLIDGGYDPYVKHLIMHLEDHKIDHINYFLNTHIHSDHISCFKDLIWRGLGPDMMYLTTQLDERYRRQNELKHYLNKYNIPSRLLVDGETLTVGGASVLVMRAQGDFGYNGRSTCNLITFGDARVLTMADATGPAQAELMARYGDVLHADILKMAHHGYNPAVAGFLEMVNPGFAALTNKPSEAVEAIAQVEAHGIPYMWMTKGNIIAQTDGKSWYVYQEPKKLPN